jgi:sensor histidine kinase regulating citrate/malate metabolism
MDAHTNYIQDKSSLSGIGALDREIVKYIRNQRHDFMNDIQIIWGYLQLDKSEEAKSILQGLLKNSKYIDAY